MELSKYNTFIPARSTSRYNGQYARSGDSQRLLEILRDSCKIASESKVPETAQSRFELALECYYQLQSLQLPPALQETLDEGVGSLARDFPSTWRANAAAGLCERAGKVKRSATQLKYLWQALEILDEGLQAAEGDVDALREIREQVQAFIEQVEKGGAVGEDQDPSTTLPSVAEQIVRAVESESEAEPFADKEALEFESVADLDEAGDEDEEAAKDDFQFEMLSKLHVALADNGLPLVHVCEVLRRGGQDWRGCRLVIEDAGASGESGEAGPGAGPEAGMESERQRGGDPVLERLEVDLGDLMADGGWVVVGRSGRPCPLKLNRSAFDALTERRVERVLARVVDVEGALRLEASIEVEAFPTDTWMGADVVPELLAAFVVPNDPAVAELLGVMAPLLHKATGSGDLEGYQAKDPGRVLSMAWATYAALQKLEATYLGLPAGFERSGQRVRLPGQVRTGRQANCFDIALFAAAALEAAGLGALVVIVRGHAFVGVWLEPEFFPDAVVEEPLRLTKRIELRDIAVFDPTLVLHRPSADFDEARAVAERHLGAREDFVLVLDVGRARLGGIRPMGSPVDFERQEAAGVTNTVSGKASTADLERAMDERLRADALRRREESPKDRVDRWLRQLLDLTMRNKLLNCEGSRRMITLLGGRVGAIEDRLASGGSFRVLAKPTELELDRLGLTAEWDRSVIEGALAPMLQRSMKQGELRATLAQEELDKRILAIYRESRTAIEEGGANSLYLAVGFLDFYETPKSRKRRRAPLLLVPLVLSRGSVREGYRLSRGDDDARLNVTLMEYLERDHGVTVKGLDPLPEDDAGINVPLILRLVREAVKREDRWEVADESAIGLFSFSKYLLWKDLRDRSDELKRNQLVRHLIDSPREPFEDGVELPQTGSLDEVLEPGETYCPLLADSSQLRAVLAASRGKTLVLEGPPGTGKSQTITNLVAHCLAEGKTVLFVSEKMAALDVVHRRLVEVGLGEACLELHSNKANKKAVLEQFRNALELKPDPSRSDWKRLALEYSRSRGILNKQVKAMHRVRTSGESVHDVLGRARELADAPEFEWSLGDASGIDEAQLRVWRERLAELVRLGIDQGVGPDHPLNGVGHQEYSPKWEREASAALDEVIEAIDEVLELGRPFVDEILGGVEPATELGWGAAIDMVRVFTLVPESELGSVQGLERGIREEGIEGRARSWVEVGRELGELLEELEKKYRELPLGLDLTVLERLRRERAAAWFLPKWSKGRKIAAAFKGLHFEPKGVTVEDALEDLDKSRRILELREELEQVGEEASELLGPVWMGHRTDWGAVSRIADRWRELRERLQAVESADSRLLKPVRKWIVELKLGGLEEFTGTVTVSEALEELSRARDAGGRALAKAVELLALDDEAEPLSGSEQLTRFQNQCVAWRDAWSGIRGWCRWLGVRTEAISAGLESLVDAIDSGRLPIASADRAFERSFVENWTLNELSSDEALRAFEGSEHEQAISRFRNLDEQLLGEAKLEIRKRMLSCGPMRGTESGAPKRSERGVLEHELAKKTRHKAIRKLLSGTPTLSLQLKPCFLMSPMSVAQYLSPGFPEFDLVVFDEASQIPVWDAIGALARGKQAVVVGDPKQLPPTSFFSRSEDETVGEDQIEDLESILEECMGAQIPTLSLAWHYRSRHESLIAFSNERYYGGGLLTFPSNSDADLGVSLKYCEGAVYDKGATRTNRREAEALVEEVIARLTDPRRQLASIGVVTFSQPQQTLIQDLLDEAQRERPTLEAFFTEGNDEAVFVKNLENVQGDERDVILFSIGYGPDEQGKIAMNFGPLNKEGGQRRLNVAVTRARREVVVFASLHAHQIDLGRTRAEGVRDLKAFLEYAEGGGAVGRMSAVGGGRESSLLVANLRQALRERGWQVEEQLGASEYRIDLAVMDPDRPNEFLMGIETDGPNYASAATARDRDRLRSVVLEGLGWSLYRVWSIDWFNDPAVQIAALHAELERVLSNRRLPVPFEAGESLVQESPEQFDAGPESEFDSDGGPAVPDLREGTASPVDVVASEDPEAQAEQSIRSELAQEHSGRCAGVYRALTRTRGLDQDVIHDPESDEAIRTLVREVLQEEAPIEAKLLKTRVVNLWGFKRMHDRTERRVTGIIDGMSLACSAYGTQVVYWRDAEQRATHDTYRVPGEGDGISRDFRGIPAPEVCAALIEQLERFGQMHDEPLLKKANTALGGKSLSRPRKQSLLDVLDMMRAEGLVEHHDGQFRRVAIQSHVLRGRSL